MAKHHLLCRDGRNVITVADDLLGLHATSNVTPYLSVFNRIDKFAPASLTRELYKTNGLSRVRAMRGTFFLVTKRLRPVIETATRFQPKRISKSLQKAGIPPSEFQRLSRLILNTLSREPKTLPELKMDLAPTRLRSLDWRRGWRVTRRTNVGVVVQLLLLERKIQSKSEELDWKSVDWDGYGRRTFTRIGKVRYELAPATASAPIEYEAARRELTELYVKHYGPVSTDDVAWWMDDSRLEVKRLLGYLQERVRRIRVDDTSEEYLVHESDIRALQETRADMTATCFLPYEDSYSKGYKLKGRIIPSSVEKIVYPMGNAMPTVVLAGKIIGMWNTMDDGKNPVLMVHKLASIPNSSETLILNEGRRLGDFLWGTGRGKVSFS